MRLPEHHRSYRQLLDRIACDEGIDPGRARSALHAAKSAALLIPLRRRKQWTAEKLNIDSVAVEKARTNVHVIDGHLVTYWDSIKSHVRPGQDHVGYSENPLLAARVFERTAWGTGYTNFRFWALQYVLLHCDFPFAGSRCTA
jgi:hypothetical protein